MAGPLDGYKILDLTQVVSGPFATMLLADQGADVIKVEPVSGLGDITRLPSFDKGGIGAFYMNNNRGKQSISLDLSQCGSLGNQAINRGNGCFRTELSPRGDRKTGFRVRRSCSYQSQSYLYLN